MSLPWTNLHWEHRLNKRLKIFRSFELVQHRIKFCVVHSRFDKFPECTLLNSSSWFVSNFWLSEAHFHVRHTHKDLLALHINVKCYERAPTLCTVNNICMRNISTNIKTMLRSFAKAPSGDKLYWQRCNKWKAHLISWRKCMDNLDVSFPSSSLPE